MHVVSRFINQDHAAPHDDACVTRDDMLHVKTWGGTSIKYNIYIYKGPLLAFFPVLVFPLILIPHDLFFGTSMVY